jgi:hypothetical protein
MALGQAFRAFFSLLTGSELPADLATELGYVKAAAKKPEPVAPPVTPADGSLQLLGILQRDARFLDFVMENLSGYSDEQIGGAVRTLHENTRAALDRYVALAPVIDGVEGTFAKVPAGASANDVKLLGKVPADGKAPGGTLRHKGWKVTKVDFPPVFAHQKSEVIAPAEVEIE